MTEAPQFEGPLRNPDVSEDADREMDKAMERMSAEAARRTIPEFAQLESWRPSQDDQMSVKRYVTAAEERLPYARAIQENIEASRSSRIEKEKAAEATRQAEALETLQSTLPSNPHVDSETAGSTN